MADVKKGPADIPPGQGEQMQQGDAKKINDARAQFPLPHEHPMLQEEPRPTGPDGGPMPPQGVKFVADGDGADDEGTLDEDQQILWEGQGGAGAGNPRDMLLQASARRHSMDLPVPTKLLRMLPYLQQLAQDPHAPESVRAFYRATVLSIENRVRKQNG